MHIWSHLPHGHAFAQLVKRATDAAAQRYSDTTPMRVVLEDPRAAELLPRFGFTLVDQRWPAWRSSEPAQFWERAHWPYGALWANLKGRLPKLIESQGREDGTVRQSIATTAAEALWDEECTRYARAPEPVAPASGPDYLAATVGALPGPAWTLTADGTAIERHLPAQPFRYAPSATPLPLQLKNGLLLDLLCWAVLPPDTRDNPGPVAEIVYLSPVGGQKKLKAAWASLMDHKREILRLPDDHHGHTATLDYIAARRVDGKGMYTAHWNDEPLPESGLAHLVIQHVSVHRPRTGQPFLHVTGMEGLPDLPHFFLQLDIASPYPLQPAWATTLWEEGRAHDLIVRLPSRGCTGFWVRTDDPMWAQIVAQCAGGTGEVQIETVGTASAHAAVTEVVNEDDDA